MVYFQPPHHNLTSTGWNSGGPSRPTLWRVRPVAQRFGEWPSASRTFSTITDFIAVVQREVVSFLCSFFSVRHTCSTSSCLPAEIVVDCSDVLAVKVSPPHEEMARLVVLRYVGESASVPGFFCDGTGTLYRLLYVTCS